MISARLRVMNSWSTSLSYAAVRPARCSIGHSELYPDGDGRRRGHWIGHGLGPTFRNQHCGCLVGKLHDVSHLLVGNIDPIQASCKFTGQADAHHPATSKDPANCCCPNPQMSRSQRRTVNIRQWKCIGPLHVSASRNLFESEQHLAGSRFTLLSGSFPMIETDEDEERLARVERMLAQCRRESAALKVVAASKVVLSVVDAAASLDAKHAVRPAKPQTTRRGSQGHRH
jgi:hypothetical protein